MSSRFIVCANYPVPCPQPAMPALFALLCALKLSPVEYIIRAPHHALQATPLTSIPFFKAPCSLAIDLTHTTFSLLLLQVCLAELTLPHYSGL